MALVRQPKTVGFRLNFQVRYIRRPTVNVLTLSHPGYFKQFAQKQLSRTWLCTEISLVR